MVYHLPTLLFAVAYLVLAIEYFQPGALDRISEQFCIQLLPGALAFSTLAPVVAIAVKG